MPGNGMTQAQSICNYFARSVTNIQMFEKKRILFAVMIAKQTARIKLNTLSKV